MERTGEKKLLAAGFIWTLLLTTYSLWQICFNRAGWGDEFAFIDIAANYVAFGEWQAYNYMDVTWSLYTWLAVPWLKVFGISHVSVCGFNLLFYALSLMMMSYVLVRRGILHSQLGITVFFCALACSSNFMWTVASGRYDMCALFLSVLILERITADVKRERLTRWLLLTYMFLLMKTMVYTIPLLGFYGIMLLVFPPKGIARIDVFWRGMYCAIGAIVGFAANMIYNFTQHHLLYYFYNLFMHNSALAGYAEGSAVGFPQCYYESYAWILLSIVAMIMAFKKIKCISIQNIIFILAIPCLMVLAGRYAYYYRYLWIVPVCGLTAWTVQHIERRILRICVAIVAVGFCIFSCGRWVSNFIDRPFLAEQKRFVNFLTKCNLSIERGDILIMSEGAYYYSAISIGLKPWIRTADSLRHTVQSKVDALVESRIDNLWLKKMIVDFYWRYEEIPYPKLPESRAFVFTETKEEKDAFVVSFWQNGYEVEEIANDGEFSVLRVLKRIGQ